MFLGACDPDVDQGECHLWDVRTVLADDHQAAAQAVLGIQGGMVLGGAPTASGVSQVDHGGHAQWSVTLDPPATGYADIKDVIRSPTGGFVVVAQEGTSAYPSGKQVWVAGLSADGALLWQTELGAAHFVVWMKGNVLAHPEGGYVVSWHDSQDDGVDARLRLARVDDLGTPLWDASHALGANSPAAESWARGGAGLLPDGSILQLTTEADRLRLVRTGADGVLVSDVVLDVAGWPMDLLVLPDGGVLVAANTAHQARVLEILPDGTVVTNESYGDGTNPSIDALQWDPVHEVIFAGGTAREPSGRQRPWTLLLERDGTEILSRLDAKGTVGLVYDASPLPEGGFAVVRHGSISVHLETVTPCIEL